ncbi:MAG: hypothetical protein FWK04_06190 [Nostoc sp. GBBB01]|nr:hypothetical protein [Nostoc sp. GBBB01]
MNGLGSGGLGKNPSGRGKGKGERGKGKGKGERGKGKGKRVRGKGKGKRRKVGSEETSNPNFVTEEKDGSFLSPLPLTLSPVAL